MVAAGSVLRRARRRAGLSQTELARRAGVVQSVVSAYESGSRQPSVPMLERLVAATGHELDIRVRRKTSSRALTGPVGRRVRRHRREIRQITSAYGLGNPRVFGSLARGEDRPDSDVDLLVDVPAGVGLVTVGRCQAYLEALLGARVDLIPAGELKPGVSERVLREAVAL